MEIPKFEEKELKVVREIPGLLSMRRQKYSIFRFNPGSLSQNDGAQTCLAGQQC
jgi:5-bromo-4-chloroindolyl phosphate hydrolysis protein